MSELIVYKASAGSGKTFTLAVEYIKSLIRNPRAYRQILAVTFTNKATAEMKERILSQLYGIQIGDPDSDAYLKRIIAETGHSEDEIRTTAGIALGYMLHDYSRFRVETFVSFFQSVMRNLARELELSPNLNIELSSFSETFEELMSLPNYPQFACEFAEHMEQLYVAEGYSEETNINNMIVQLLLLEGYCTTEDVARGSVIEKVNRETIAAAKYAVVRYLEGERVKRASSGKPVEKIAATGTGKKVATKGIRKK